MTRIAVGGFLHETNTFAPTKAVYDAFVHGGGWPPMLQGAKLLEKMRNVNVGMAGFVPAAEAEGWELVPTIWCAASPSAHVTKDAYERVAQAIVDGIKTAGAIDGVYLDLHGAMVAEHLDDGEGEILARVREAIGKELPLVVSLDLHANVTPEMVEHADALIAYRTYPHVGRHRSRRRGSRAAAARGGASRSVPAVSDSDQLAVHHDQPTKGIYQKLAALESDAVPTLSFAPGFPAADFPDCGATVFAYGKTQADADAAADNIAALIESHENDFDGRIYTPDDGVRHAMELATRASRPIVIADTQDNPGAGGDSDTTGMLRALVRNGATKAAIGVIVDPESAKAAHAAGQGATIRLALGGKSGIPGDTPFEATFVVEQLSDGQFIAPGPYFGGSRMNLGPSAALRIGGVRVVVGSRKAQLADQAMFRYVGIESRPSNPSSSTKARCISAPISEPIAEQLIICAAPGAMPADTAALPWTRLRRAFASNRTVQPLLPKPNHAHLLQRDKDKMPIIERIEGFADELTAIRRDLHAHPEIGFEEVRTSGIVADKLTQWGIEVHRGLGGTGVVGVLKGKGNGGKRIGLRADMDALPMEENTNLRWRSTIPGRFHGCGHDGHTTMLLGTARYLAETRNFDGTVHFIFQPAEEGLGGARAMIKDGLFEKFPCDEIYGLHNAPDLNHGEIAILPGPAMAGADFFDITIDGYGAHGAMPERSKDAVVIAMTLGQALQTVVSRNVDPLQAAVLSITQIHAGSAYNVIPGQAKLCGTVRAFSDEVRALIRERMRAICAGIASAFQVEIIADIRDIFSVLVNQEEQSQVVAEVARTVVDPANVLLRSQPKMGSEDFADMMQAIPGAYFWVGHEGSVPVHNPGYVLDDKILPIGASMFARIIETRLPVGAHA
jgi:hippurate hydrolase